MIISLNNFNIQIPQKTMGIDMGATLTKIAHIDEKGKDSISLSTFDTQYQSDEIRQYLNLKLDTYELLNFTGGRAINLNQSFSEKIKTNLLLEFDTNVKGVETLFHMEKGKELPPSLIVNIGTGTSVTLKNEGFEHLGGTALGGGFFMGLCHILYNLSDFQEALDLAKKGNRYNVDLKVGDIYPPEDDRVDFIFREFTAAALGKVIKKTNIDSVVKEDLIGSLICLIGENIGTMACLMANNNTINTLLFCGGFLKDNMILRKTLSLLCRYYKKKAVFLKNSEYNGAIGALML